MFQRLIPVVVLASIAAAALACRIGWLPEITIAGYRLGPTLPPKKPSLVVRRIEAPAAPEATGAVALSMPGVETGALIVVPTSARAGSGFVDTRSSIVGRAGSYASSTVSQDDVRREKSLNHNQYTEAFVAGRSRKN
ncbi:MAG: hypothetical protein KF745_05695 [Phycisphaeraceae bacterium]|nr:hypothetical protein [Phycisphaeraceae bacterium]